MENDRRLPFAFFRWPVDEQSDIADVRHRFHLRAYPTTFSSDAFFYFVARYWDKHLSKELATSQSRLLLRGYHFFRGVFVVMHLGFTLRSEIVRSLLKLILETVSITPVT